MQEDSLDGKPTEATYRKRSVAVSLVLVAGAGVAAIALDDWDSCGRKEDVLVYETLEACFGQRQRTAGDCTAAHNAAEAAYPTSAPRYVAGDDCRTRHGREGCVTGETVSPSAAGLFVPVMAGFMMGRTAEQNLPPQPLYQRTAANQPVDFAGSYSTGAGGHVTTGRESSATRVPASVAYTTTSSPRMIAQGGFGETGRAVAASCGGRLRGFGG